MFVSEGPVIGIIGITYAKIGVYLFVIRKQTCPLAKGFPIDLKRFDICCNPAH